MPIAVIISHKKQTQLFILSAVFFFSDLLTFNYVSAVLSSYPVA